MTDFFISYHKADQAWADWIAWQLEYAGYSTVAQAYRSQPDSDALLEMQRAAAEASRTIAVLSADYLSAVDWETLVHGIAGAEGNLVPVRVRECSLEGLSPGFKCIDLMNLGQDAAWTSLLSGVRQDWDRPLVGFSPGETDSPTGVPPPFPAAPGVLPPIWNVPHPRNPHFTGRVGLLAALTHILGVRGLAALNQSIAGQGGVGKTQIAVEYAYRHAAEYDIVWWVRADQNVTLAADYAALSVPLRLPERDHPDQQVVIEAVRRRLGTLTRWLLIFDGAERPEEIHPLLPRGPVGRVLITSRRTTWQWLGQAFSVPIWSPEEGAEFLRKRIRAFAPEAQRTQERGEESAAPARQAEGEDTRPQPAPGDAGGSPEDSASPRLKLAQALGGLPLVLELAAAYMEQTGCAPGRYLQLLEMHQKQLMGEGRPAPDYPLPLAATWELAVRRLRKVSPSGAALLHLCAFLSSDDIPFSLVIDGYSHLPESLAIAALDRDQFYRAARALQSYSLAEVCDESLTVHRLVQAVSRDRLSPSDRRTWAKAAVRVVYDAFPYKASNAQTWAVCSRLLPHTLASAGHAEDLAVGPEAAGRLLHQAGLYLQQRARFNEARMVFERALHIDEMAYGRVHPNVAIRASALGRILQEMGDLSGARAAYERALRIDAAAYGPTHAAVARDASNVGAVLHQIGDLVGARMAIEQALGIDEALHGPDHPSVARDINHLGSILRASGDQVGARAAYERALRIDEAAFGMDHSRVAIDASNLGRVRQELGDLPGAREAYERALRIDEMAYGPEHPKIAIRVNNLGSVLYALGDLAGARDAYERALQIDKAACGPDHPRVALDIGSLNRVLQDMGDLTGARDAYERALRIDEEAYGPDHPNVAIDLNNLGGVLQEMGDRAGAKEAFERALHIDRMAYGPDHLNVAMDATNLGHVLQEMGDRAGAREAYTESLRVLDDVLGQDHPDTCLVRHNLETLDE